MMWITFFNVVSAILIPVFLVSVLLFGLLGGRPVFDDFLKGAKEGTGIALQLFPTLLGLLSAVGILRSSGFLDFLSNSLQKPAEWFHLPALLVPVALSRLVSNSAATGLMLDIFKTLGPDSREGITAALLLSSTETVLYCFSIYFGHVGIRRAKGCLAGAMAATAVGTAVSVWLGLHL